MIKYDLPEYSHVQLTVYNILGQTLNTLIDEWKLAGSYQIYWNSKDKFGMTVPSGIYICRMITNRYHRTIKMMLIK